MISGWSKSGSEWVGVWRTPQATWGALGRGNTAVGVFSPRTRCGFQSPIPVTWGQVERGGRPDAFIMDHSFKAVIRKAT
ncbi:hypothetical protein FJ934_12605 [Mesorhizobium sp. B2-4-12]|nr:hypothetical protein FJ934_12605 [Mesorhizobium sp. B2-4-12]